MIYTVDSLNACFNSGRSCFDERTPINSEYAGDLIARTIWKLGYDSACELYHEKQKHIEFCKTIKGYNFEQQIKDFSVILTRAVLKTNIFNYMFKNKVKLVEYYTGQLSFLAKTQDELLSLLDKEINGEKEEIYLGPRAEG